MILSDKDLIAMNEYEQVSDMIDCLLEIDNQEYYSNHYEDEYYQDLD